MGLSWAIYFLPVAAFLSLPGGLRRLDFRARGRCRWLLLACVGAIHAPMMAAVQAYTARATSIPDGDTLWVQPDAGGPPRKLRLQGVDAPELCQRGGVAARDSLRALLANRELTIQVRSVDDYGRELARIQVGAQDVAAVMVQRGQAWSYRWRRSLGPYAVEEAAARQAKIGLFAEPDPELPRDFRQRYGSCYTPDADGAFRLK